REPICLVFPKLRLVVVRFLKSFEEDSLLAMQQDVRGFMKEAEPKYVFPSVAKAYLDERLRWGEPPGRTVCPCALKGFEYDDGDPGRCACSYQLRLPIARIKPGELPNVAECFLKTVAVIGRGVDPRRLNLARAEPGGKRLR